VQGVGPGTVFGERYALRRRLSHRPDVERWSALDVTLDREVTLIVIGAEHPSSPGVIDAARRAAGVENARLVRILDVGTQNDTSFIVEEAMVGSESLATILLQGPLPAEEARRVAGETAKSLETAGQRGLHHLRLTPHHVLIAPDGAIMVSGVTVAAAIDGPGEQEPDTAVALRRDALCLVAVVYAALTCRWPLDETVGGLEPAPRLSDGVVAPSEIVSGIPGDLDALCREALNDAGGPCSPGDFARRIAPWPRERVHRAGVDPTLVLRRPSTDEASDVAPATVPVVAPLTNPVAPPVVTPVAPPVVTPVALPVVARVALPVVPVTGDRTEPTVAVSKDDLATQSPTNEPPEPVGQAAAASPADTRRFVTSRPGAGTVPGAASGALSSSAGAPVQQSAEQVIHGRDRMRLPMGLTGEDDIGPPLPMLPASTALPPSRGQSKAVMVVMAAFVVAALFVGYRGLMGPSSNASQGRSTPRRTVTVKGPAVTVPASPAPQAAATAGGPIAILSATGFDPQGDHVENNSQAARVYDGDPATAWTSELYATAQFGNLKKGVGLLLDLGQPTSIHQVTIDLAHGPVDLTVYAATSPGLAGAAVIGTATAATGRVQVKATTPMPESEFIIVWFSSLSPAGGQFGASVSEIALN
jgi:hypothetical protein